MGAGSTTTRPSSSSPSGPAGRPPTPRWMLHAAVGVLFLIIMLAASVSGPPGFRPPLLDTSREPLPEPTRTGEPAPGVPRPGNDDLVSSILSIVMLVLVIGVVAVLLYVVIRLLVLWLREMASRPRAVDGAPVDAESHGTSAGEEPLDAAVMRRGIAAALSHIAAHPDPGDAIVAAWIGLEETAADSGTARGVSETPAEFTVRILLRRSDIGEPVRRLLSLYERVRFGDLAADEGDRTAARAALTAIQDGWRR